MQGGTLFKRVYSPHLRKELGRVSPEKWYLTVKVIPGKRHGLQSKWKCLSVQYPIMIFSRSWPPLNKLLSSCENVGKLSMCIWVHPRIAIDFLLVLNSPILSLLNYNIIYTATREILIRLYCSLLKTLQWLPICIRSLDSKQPLVA